MCNVPCSKSGIVNPVDFVLQEGHTAAKLLSGKIDVGKQKAIINEEYMILKQAIKYSQVQSVVYFTSSDYPGENEDLVARVLNEYRAEANHKSPFLLTEFLPDLVASLKSHAHGTPEEIPTALIGSGMESLCVFWGLIIGLSYCP